MIGLTLAGCGDKTPLPTATSSSGYPPPSGNVTLPTSYPGQSTQPAPGAGIPTPDILTEPPELTGQVVFHAGGDNANNIIVVDLSSGQSRQLTLGGDNIEPNWSPDGAQIAFACLSGQFYGICIMDADGSNRHQVVSGSFNAWGLNWSPDGTQLVFVSSEVPYSHLYVLDIASGSVRRLLQSPGNEGSPRWSPDGNRIIFMTDRNGQFDIYTVRPDGSDERRITSFGKDDRPAWSADGQLITFRREVVSSSIFSGNEIVVMGANGQNERQLTSDNRADDWPSFSPDGKWIIYSTLRGGAPFLQVVPVEGGLAAPLVLGGLEGNASDWKP